MDQTIRIHTFAGGGALPTTGPLSLKLMMALRMMDIPYELVVDPNFKNSPKRKVPWVEIGELKMADTALILALLAEQRGFDLERGLTPLERAQGLALRVLLEEHWHQIFEIELILDPEGVGAHMGPAVQEHFRHHLYERGMLRHTREEIIAFGKVDLDAVAAWLDGRQWAIGNEPTLTDCSLFGLLAPSIYSGIPTPCMTYARTLTPIVAFIERARQRFFPELPASAAAAKAGLAAAPS
jgi:glutathione S-transferase